MSFPRIILSLEINKYNFRLVFVHDPTDDGGAVVPIGKQTLRPSHIFYTPCSGIWQTVWLEAAPQNHITKLDLDSNMDGQGKFSFVKYSAITHYSIQSTLLCTHLPRIPPQTYRSLYTTMERSSKATVDPPISPSSSTSSLLTFGLQIRLSCITSL